jgi:hypothetical protein
MDLGSEIFWGDGVTALPPPRAQGNPRSSASQFMCDSGRQETECLGGLGGGAVAPEYFGSRFHGAEIFWRNGSAPQIPKSVGLQPYRFIHGLHSRRPTVSGSLGSRAVPCRSRTHGRKRFCWKSVLPECFGSRAHPKHEMRLHRTFWKYISTCLSSLLTVANDRR